MDHEQTQKTNWKNICNAYDKEIKPLNKELQIHRKKKTT